MCLKLKNNNNNNNKKKRVKEIIGEDDAGTRELYIKQRLKLPFLT